MLSRGSSLVRNRFVAARSRLLVVSQGLSTRQQQQQVLSSVAQQPASNDDEDTSGATSGAGAAGATNGGIVDSFELLGLPRKFKVSPNELKKSYRALMTKYHPDKQHSHNNNNNNDATETEAEQAEPLSPEEDIEAMASKVTNAFRIIKEPHTRAKHLLELVGSPVDETSQTDLVGAEFLMEIMELREDVDATDPKYLKPQWDETKARMDQIVEELDLVFEQKNYAKAMELASQLQYWRRIQRAIHEKMDLEDRSD